MKQFRSILVLCLAFNFATQSQATNEEKYDPESLNTLVENVRKLVDEKGKPVVVFDIDDTIMNSRSRTERILKAFVKQGKVRKQYPSETRAIEQMEIADIRYLLKDTFKQLGISNEEFLKTADEFWAKKFFSNEYCAKDDVIREAPDYVRRLRNAGAFIVYLSGRDKPRMERCTRESLLNNRFPLDYKTALLLKPNKDVDDLKFKQAAFELIAKKGTVIGGFENEPANVNAYKDAFPEGLMIFLDTSHSNKPDVPKAGIPWVKDYVTEEF